MTPKILIVLLLFSFSLAYAHPNHMNFENVKHDEVQNNIILNSVDKISHQDMDGKQGHSDAIPCKEQQQHRITPCKKK